MKFILPLSLILLAACPAFSQTPKLYIHLVSHNEPNDNLQTNLNYQKAKANLKTMATIVNAKNVKWNLQTSDGLVFGARTDQQMTGSNIFSTLASAPYTDNIEIDPRSKNFPGRNIADQWLLLDSLGAHPSHTVGGFIYAVCQPNNTSSIDWWQYQDTLKGLQYGNKVKFTLLSGAGSLPPHCNDLNDFGIFKPDTTTNFYAHNPARKLWCVGTGCAPVLDSLSDEQAIIDLIQAQVDSIQNGLWPQDKFYVTRIMTNQREYGPLFFSKLNRVLDSLALIPDNRLEWANISECFSAFQSWSASSGEKSSMWLCDHEAVATEEPEPIPLRIYPNPFSDKTTLQTSGSLDNATLSLLNLYGQVLKRFEHPGGQTLEIPRGELPAGIYFLSLEERGRVVGVEKISVY